MSPLVRRWVAEVLAGQPDAPELDPDQITALLGRTGLGTAERGGVGAWELRVAAVASVISGESTRGQTARRFGLRSQDVAHWVARHHQQMPLHEPAEEGHSCGPC